MILLDLRPRLLERNNLLMNLQPLKNGTYLGWVDIHGTEIRRKGRDRAHAIKRISDAINAHFQKEGIALGVDKVIQR